MKTNLAMLWPGGAADAKKQRSLPSTISAKDYNAENILKIVWASLLRCSDAECLTVLRQ